MTSTQMPGNKARASKRRCTVDTLHGKRCRCACMRTSLARCASHAVSRFVDLERFGGWVPCQALELLPHEMFWGDRRRCEEPTLEGKPCRNRRSSGRQCCTVHYAAHRLRTTLAAKASELAALKLRVARRVIRKAVVHWWYSPRGRGAKRAIASAEAARDSLATPQQR